MRRNRREQSQHGPSRRRRPKHAWPTCARTGKRRYDERKDAKTELERARHKRAHAELDGRKSSLTVCRAYYCEFCRGWHLTSLPTWRDMQYSAVSA
jgi:hypothetical protein